MCQELRVAPVASGPGASSTARVDGDVILSKRRLVAIQAERSQGHCPMSKATALDDSEYWSSAQRRPAKPHAVLCCVTTTSWPRARALQHRAYSRCELKRRVDWINRILLSILRQIMLAVDGRPPDQPRSKRRCRPLATRHARLSSKHLQTTQTRRSKPQETDRCQISQILSSRHTAVSG